VWKKYNDYERNKRIEAPRLKEETFNPTTKSLTHIFLSYFP
jgi:hypothetical protein